MSPVIVAACNTVICPLAFCRKNKHLQNELLFIKAIDLLCRRRYSKIIAAWLSRAAYLGMAGANNMAVKFFSLAKKYIGLRTIKTFLAVFVSAMIMYYGFRQPPFFACIGAVVAMEKNIAASIRVAVIRNVATLTGALVGIAIASFTENILLLSLGIIPLIWVNRALNKTESIVPGAIVYFAVAYLNTMDAAWLYGVMRVAGTFLGTLVALVINATIFPPKETEETTSAAACP